MQNKQILRGVEIPMERFSFAIAIDLQKTEERVLIDTADNIQRKLRGDQGISLFYDQSRPLGQLLFDYEEQDDGEWFGEVICPINQLLQNSKRGGILSPEVQDVLEHHIKSSNPVGQYTALNAAQFFFCEVDVVRGSKWINLFDSRMRNLVKSFQGELLSVAYFKPFAVAYSKVQMIIHHNRLYCRDEMKTLDPLSDRRLECFMTDGDIIPLVAKYLMLLSENKYKLKLCDRCGKRFVAGHGNATLCSDLCRSERQKQHCREHAVRTKESEKDVAYKSCRRVMKRCLNGVKKRCGESSEKYCLTKVRYDVFLQEGKARKAAVKTYADFKRFEDWLFAQEREFRAFCGGES